MVTLNTQLNENLPLGCGCSSCMSGSNLSLSDNISDGVGNPLVTGGALSDIAISSAAQSEYVGYSNDGLNDEDQGVDALIRGSRWVDPNLTFSFPNQASDYGANYGDVSVNTFAAFINQQQIGGRTAFANYEAVSGLDFTEITGTNDGDATFRLGNSDNPSTAYAYYPTSSDLGGDSWYGTNYNYTNAKLGTYAFHTIIHEIGHGVGLKHGQETNYGGAIPYEQDSMEYSIMTYKSYVGDDNGGYNNAGDSYAQSLMMLDIAAVQRLYGANFQENSGDTTYTFSTTTGIMSVDGQSSLEFGQTMQGNKIFRTVWDGNGNDTYDFSNYSRSLEIDLSPGGYVDLDVNGNAQRARLGAGEYARGHVFNALQHNGDDRSLIENAIGGSADDILIGNTADNILDGRGGTDTVLYSGLFSDFRFTVNSLTDIFVEAVSGAIDWGTDHVLNVEWFQFTDVLKSASDIFEDNSVEDTVNLSGMNSYGGSQDKDSDWNVINGGSTVTLDQNTWSKISFDYTVTENTILEFDFSSTSIGDIHGIGFDTNNGISSGYTFELYGTQTWGLQDFRTYSGSGTETFSIRVGDYYTGDFDYLMFVNDDDTSNPDANSVFSNIRIYEAIANSDVNILNMSSYGGSQDHDSSWSVSGDGSTVTLDQNTWSKIAFDYTITENTILEFDFSSTSIGDIHGIGFDTNNGVSAGYTFMVYGTQLSWGIKDYNTYDGSGTDTFQIRVGDFYTGDFDYLTFTNDHDVPNPDSNSTFSNIRVYEDDTGGSALSDILFDGDADHLAHLLESVSSDHDHDHDHDDDHHGSEHFADVDHTDGYLDIYDTQGLEPLPNIDTDIL